MSPYLLGFLVGLAYGVVYVVRHRRPYGPADRFVSPVGEEHGLDVGQRVEIAAVPDDDLAGATFVVTAVEGPSTVRMRRLRKWWQL